MSTRLGKDDWYVDLDNLVCLLDWAVSEYWEAEAIVWIVKWPWKYRTEFVVAYCKQRDGGKVTA